MKSPRLPAFLALLFIAACATGVDQERSADRPKSVEEARPVIIETPHYAKVGEHDREGNFDLLADYQKPADFKLTPEEVAMKYGKLCKAKQACTYFMDDQNYYLVADYSPELPNDRIPQIACPVVSGTSGTLLKIC
jgi:hypothetical protein